MKFICKQENLKRGVGLVSHLAGKNQNLPILNNVLLEVQQGVLNLSTTNLEIGMKSTVRGKAEQEGSLTIPAKLLNDYIGTLKNENIELEQKGNNLKITSTNNQTTIKGVEASEFPLIPEVDKKTTLKIKNSELKESLAMVLFACAIDNTRPEISGVYFNVLEKEIVLAATDSYRLAEKKIKYQLESGDGRKIIIPSSTLQELHRILNDVGSDSEVEVQMNDNQVLFAIDSTRLVSRVIEGEYPDYQQVIPLESNTKAVIKTQELLQAVRSTSLFCRKGINDVSIVVTKEKIEVKALNDQVGENQTAVEVLSVTGENEIVFNYHYVLDGLNSMGSEEVEFGLNSNTLPGIFVPRGRSDYVYIVMPIKQ